MPTNYPPRRPDWVVQQLIESFVSSRKVRRVVTPSGNRARGYFASVKGKHARFESLVEEDALRVLEVAPSVLSIQTHPYVLRLTNERDSSRTLHYTPDAVVGLADTATLLEIKGDWLLRLPSSRDSFRRTLLSLRQHDVPIAMLSESDVRPAGLQTELKLLLRARPVGARQRSRLDASAWDPTGATEPSGETLRRWRAAQKECDALLDRVMRRDPDELIAALQA